MPRTNSEHYRKEGKDMTAEHLRQLGYNDIEIALILEIIEEGRK